MESHDIEDVPNIFAKRCVKLLPENAVILEIGAANGRDSRFFAREKHAEVIATDFSLNALRQLKDASERDATANKVFPVVADARALPLAKPESIDAVYSRSALHLTDGELDHFFRECLNLLKDEGYFMIEGKTDEDPKVTASKEIFPHLYENGGGHLRRSWNEEIINDFVKKYGLHLIAINKTTEIWNKIEARFINFIAQKQKENASGS